MTDWTDWLPAANSALGIYRGATSRSPLAQTRAGLGGAKLGSNLYNKYVGDSGLSSGINTGATGALDALGIYQGLEQGGWQGYGKAGASGLQLAGLLSENPALATAGGYIMAPIDAYNEVKNWRSGATGADALSGAETGAAIGSVIPVIGTALGAVTGGAVGALSSAFGPGAKDPETYAVQNVIDAVSSNKNNPNVAAQASDPYLELAGLMDRRSSTLPEYAQYGRMGEQKFTNDMVTQINNAIKANPALAKDPNAVYNQVVSPWVNKMGSGYSNVGQAYTATNQGLIQDMVNQYMSGNAAQDWKAIGGDSPFANIYQNSPIAAAPAQATPPAASPINNVRPVNSAHSMLAAKGGEVKDPELKRKLRELYADSFTNRKQHFGIGGEVGDTTGVSWTPDTQNTFYPSYQAPSNTYDVLQSNSGAGSPDTSNYWLPQYDEAQAAAAQAYQDAGGTYGGGSSAGSDSSGNGSSIFGQGGALSSLGNLLGVSSTGQLIQKYGALAPLLAAALGGGNKPASAPATPAGYGAIPSIATPSYSRPYTQPNIANWYTYGQGPEQSFFGNNQLPTIPGVSPGTGAAGTPQGSGQMSTQPIPYSGTQPMPIVRAKGGPAFDSTQGDSYVQDPGAGDGTSDDIDAKLSGGEYVMDAGTVSMLGNGSNEAGARALDQLRQRVRQHAGKHLVKGKQFMKAKAPEAYLKGSKAS